MSTPDFIRRYAMLKVAEETLTASRRAVPPQILGEIAKIENMARARLTPQQLQSAQHHAEVAKLQIRQEAAASAEQRRLQTAQRAADSTVGSLTAGMLGRTGGLTRAELDQVAAGKALPKAKRLTQQERDAIYKQQTRTYDPNGQGWSEAEWTRRLDELADADPERYAALSKQYRAQPDQLRGTVQRWKDDRYEYGVRKRREASDRFRGTEPLADRPPNYEERRRAALVKAYAQHTADALDADISVGRTDSIDDFEERVPDELRNESTPDGGLTRRAHIARALEHHTPEVA